MSPLLCQPSWGSPYRPPISPWPLHACHSEVASVIIAPKSVFWCSFIPKLVGNTVVGATCCLSPHSYSGFLLEAYQSSTRMLIIFHAWKGASHMQVFTNVIFPILKFPLFVHVTPPQQSFLLWRFSEENWVPPQCQNANDAWQWCGTFLKAVPRDW